MIWRCGYGRHPDMVPTASNAGLEVGSCSRCRAELIRIDGGPCRVVPPGYRITWSDRQEAKRSRLVTRHRAALKAIVRIDAARDTPVDLRTAPAA